MNKIFLKTWKLVNSGETKPKTMQCNKDKNILSLGQFFNGILTWKALTWDMCRFQQFISKFIIVTL